MKDDDPRDDLDDFTQALVSQLRDEIVYAATHLVASNHDIARVQIQMLRERAVRRIKTIDFEHGVWLAQASPSELPEKDVLKVIRIALAAVESAYDSVLDAIAENERSDFGGDGEGDLPE